MGDHVSNTVYVDAKFGTRRGKVENSGRPFRMLWQAIKAIKHLASKNNPYTIIVRSGIHYAGDFKLPDGVTITGVGKATTIIGRVSVKGSATISNVNLIAVNSSIISQCGTICILCQICELGGPCPKYCRNRSVAFTNCNVSTIWTNQALEQNTILSELPSLALTDCIVNITSYGGGTVNLYKHTASELEVINNKHNNNTVTPKFVTVVTGEKIKLVNTEFTIVTLAGANKVTVAGANLLIQLPANAESSRIKFSHTAFNEITGKEETHVTLKPGLQLLISTFDLTPCNSPAYSFALTPISSNGPGTTQTTIYRSEVSAQNFTTLTLGQELVLTSNLASQYLVLAGNNTIQLYNSSLIIVNPIDAPDSKVISNYYLVNKKCEKHHHVTVKPGQTIAFTQIQSWQSPDDDDDKPVRPFVYYEYKIYADPAELGIITGALSSSFGTHIRPRNEVEIKTPNYNLGIAGPSLMVVTFLLETQVNITYTLGTNIFTGELPSPVCKIRQVFNGTSTVNNILPHLNSDSTQAFDYKLAYPNSIWLWAVAPRDNPNLVYFAIGPPPSLSIPSASTLKTTIKNNFSRTLAPPGYLTNNLIVKNTDTATPITVNTATYKLSNPLAINGVTDLSLETSTDISYTIGILEGNEIFDFKSIPAYRITQTGTSTSIIYNVVMDNKAIDYSLTPGKTIWLWIIKFNRPRQVYYAIRPGPHHEISHNVETHNVEITNINTLTLNPKETIYLGNPPFYNNIILAAGSTISLPTANGPFLVGHPASIIVTFPTTASNSGDTATILDVLNNGGQIIVMPGERYKLTLSAIINFGIYTYGYKATLITPAAGNNLQTAVKIGLGDNPLNFTNKNQTLDYSNQSFLFDQVNFLAGDTLILPSGGVDMLPQIYLQSPVYVTLKSQAASPATILGLLASDVKVNPGQTYKLSVHSLLNPVVTGYVAKLVVTPWKPLTEVANLSIGNGNIIDTLLYSDHPNAIAQVDNVVGNKIPQALAVTFPDGQDAQYQFKKVATFNAHQRGGNQGELIINTDETNFNIPAYVKTVSFNNGGNTLLPTITFPNNPSAKTVVHGTHLIVTNGSTNQLTVNAPNGQPIILDGQPVPSFFVNQYENYTLLANVSGNTLTWHVTAKGLANIGPVAKK